MSPNNTRRLQRSRLSAALLSVLITPVAGLAFAQDAAAPADQADAKNLDTVTVTGSLIPVTEVETFTPVTVVSAEDIQMRGFQSVADVLQQSTFSTGGVQGGQTSASFTQGAEASNMFGLDPGYTKYLINGRPMANYPALYNGSDVFNNISGIPVALVDRIEILPGGQSSLYGSDAIAGVVNVILKKNLDQAELSIRGGWFSEGGGDSVRFTFADSISSADGRLNTLFGIQYDERDPIWGHQRDLTDSYNNDGYSAAHPSRDFVVIDALDSSYYFTDPANCSNVTGNFGGTTQRWNRPGYGEYCGSFESPGYRTLRNGKSSTQLYSYTTFDLNDSVQLYAELMGNYEDVEYATGSNYTWWGTSSNYGAYYDPDLGALVNLQRSFAPEDIGGLGYQDIMNTDRNKSYTVTFGANGYLGDWDYNVFASRNEYKLNERGWQRWADPIEQYFSENVLGPELGLDPIYNAYPVFRPDYAAFYQPISPADFAAFTGYTTSEARTWDNLLRAQFTNGALFSLPGGDAGFAVVAEVGNEGWEYNPDQRLLDGGVWGTTSVNGDGHRSRYAVTSELRMPLLEQLTVTASARYDAFDLDGNTTDSPTYSLGVEYRPTDTLLLRGKYGTAFRAPSLADTNQGVSGYYSRNTDYYRCSLEGFDPADTEGCTWDSAQYQGSQAGNPDLEPIDADVWSAGFVWAPTQNFSLTADYFNWKIENEVDQISADQLLLTEYFCRTGASGSPITSCDNALDWIERDANGGLVSIFTPKVNVAKQDLEVVTVGANYLLDIGRFGSLAFAANYTNNLEHTVTPTPGDEAIDLLRDPYYMWIYDAYAKTRTDLSVSWAKDAWTTTVYANRIGETPNYLAYAGGGYDYVHESGASAGKWDAYTTYNLSLNYRATDDLQLSMMVNNVLNEMPDDQASNYPGTSSTPYNNYLYDVFGRAMYLEAKYTF